MNRRTALSLALALLLALPFGCALNRSSLRRAGDRAALTLHSLPMTAGARTIRLEGLFYESANGRVWLPASLKAEPRAPYIDDLAAQTRTSDGRTVKLSVTPSGDDFTVKLTAEPATGIRKWGFAIPATSTEYFTGVMERLVDGPQSETWREGRTEALNLRGQRIEMVVKPTLSVYAPFFISSRGYGLAVRGTWPGVFDFCSAGSDSVKVEFEGPSLEVKVYTSKTPAELIQAHALEAGPPILPPKWVFSPWRWRNEHRNGSEYFDGTPVIGPYNAQVMEDVMLMKHYEIPCGVYWIDRPWGPGRLGYDDFEIDEKRLPEFDSMLKWLTAGNMKVVMWIAPFVQGQMEKTALERKYVYPGQKPNQNNYPLTDLTNPQAKAFWQGGVAKLLKRGVAGFKLDRGEEDMPDRGDEKVADGRTITENRNDYPVQYVRAAYEAARQHRGEDFVLLPRAAYTGSSQYGVFWGGDIHASQWGLRASIVAVQRAAVMGYPVWGSDTGGYLGRIDREVCARWLGFSCFTPIMEVGPTANRAFWDMPEEPHYDVELIAAWRFYARLHQRLMEYSAHYAREAHERGTPIVRPLFLAYPGQAEAWNDWSTYLYGPDFLVSPIWEKGAQEKKVYLPAGERWQYAWNPEQEFQGGRTITVKAPLHQQPFFVRVGSGINLGDLNKEWAESLEIAKKKPDMRQLDENLRGRFDAEAAAREARP